MTAPRTIDAWWGTRWNGYACDDPAMQTPFPTGERCAGCERVLDEAAGEGGPYLGTPEGIRPEHWECRLFDSVGMVCDLDGTPHVVGSCRVGIDRREEALRSAQWLIDHPEWFTR